MHIKHIHEMIEKLSECAKHEFDKGIENVDTKEMGEVSEIIKELCEAEYYAKISKAMDEAEYGEDYDERGPMDDGRRGYRGQPRSKTSGRYMRRGDGRRGYEEPMYYTPGMHKDPMPDYWRDMDRDEKGRMYYSGETSSAGGNSGMSGGTSAGGSMNGGSSGTSGVRNYGGSRYENARRGYEETKKAGDDSPESKKKAMESLENYFHELSEDVTALVGKMDAGEKSIMRTKLSTLVQKLQ